MREVCYLIIFAVFVSSCANKQDSKVPVREIVNLKGFHLSLLADSLFTSYRDSIHADEYAIFFDKKEEGTKYIITFTPFVKKVAFYETVAASMFYTDNNIPVYEIFNFFYRNVGSRFKYCYCAYI